MKILLAISAGVLSMVSHFALAANLCLGHPIRLAYYESGLFYYQGKGVDVDLVQELKRRSSCAMETSIMPRVRAYMLLEAGEIDIVVAAINTPSRARYAYFAPYLQQRFATIIHPDVPRAKATLDAFTADPSLHFGVVRGVNYDTPRDNWIEHISTERRLEIAPNPAILYRMFKGNRLAALFSIPLQYEKELQDIGLRDQVHIVDWFPNQPPTTRNLALSRHNFNGDQLEAWSAMVTTLRADGTMRSILGHYLTPAEATKALLR